MATARGKGPHRNRKIQSAPGTVGTAASATPSQEAASPSAPAESVKRPPDYSVPGPNGLSLELADKLIAARETMPRRFAAKSCGVSPKTFERWLQIGSISAHDPVCVHFTRGINEIEGIDVSDTITGLQILRKVNPQATDLYLKLMHPEDFGGHIRTVPDEFDGQERNREAQDKLLSSPPPRMLAKLNEHRWFQLPEGTTPEEKAEIEAMLGAIRMRVTTQTALTMPSAESE